MAPAPLGALASSTSHRLTAKSVALGAAAVSARTISFALASSAAAASTSDTVPAWREHAALVMGFVSIACWVTVYTPQLLENYRNKSAEGLSTAFVLIWLAGDALNWLGAFLQGLLWTQIALAGYYVFCDIALLWQAWYYTKYYLNGLPIQRHPLAHGTVVPGSNGHTETTPLLHNNNQPGASTITNASAISISRRPSKKQQFLLWGTAIGFVTAVGVISFFMLKPKGPHQSPPDVELPSPDGPSAGIPKHEWRWDAQIYGWASAFLYLASRIPQIIKNRKTYCEGLSMALFVFALLGNSTYVASIMLKSLDPDYLLENASWLVGSLGVVFLDFVVLAQFVKYAPEREKIRLQVEAAAEAEAQAQAHLSGRSVPV
ncbi:putative vacuolar membrane transporter for cationic amino acids [Tilletia horrida]|uniref:Vacuolar membrane transporter for cationic amino acids n=1 Tax=Tilletia horrida TaxID=155126 RepID=A0AAN6JRR9_9BASI|nr:putative vacuolar membrane transporter for cationic amino acids [Tilletia horrida]KAK0550255.1 putative vacuolar membrane transporter for cationic amino acids [Tilletia horrida]KAK0565401.1 putative vacuolar membrane transporter for cationic amino acids [Tilletia horrida]